MASRTADDLEGRPKQDSDGRRRVRVRIALTVLLTVVAGAALVVGRQAFAVPSPTSFDGWISVLAKGPPGEGQVRLFVAPLVAGAPGTQPQVEVTLTTCAMGDRDLLLLLAGDAQLSDVAVVWPLEAVPQERHPSLVVSDAGGGASEPADALVLRVHVDDGDKCSAAGPTAVALQVAGRLSGEVQQQSVLLGISAPREFQTWPALGWAPGTSPSLTGMFTLNSGIEGEWARPRGTFDLQAGKPTLSALVESASPTLEDFRDLHWSSPSPFQAEASVIDLAQSERLQTVALFLSILFGVLSAVVIEAFSSAPPTPRQMLVLPDPSAPPGKRPSRWRALVVVVVLLAFARRRHPRRPRPGGERPHG